MAAEIVAETAQPHWILGTEHASRAHIDWPGLDGGVDEWTDTTGSSTGSMDTAGSSTDSSTSSQALSQGRYPWDEASSQPNDCDGPDTEPCIFVGPHGKWFDFACEQKTAAGTTPGSVNPPPI